jgi:hypothetical protein
MIATKPTTNGDGPTTSQTPVESILLTRARPEEPPYSWERTF